MGEATKPTDPTYPNWDSCPHGCSGKPVCEVCTNRRYESALDRAREQIASLTSRLAAVTEDRDSAVRVLRAERDEAAGLLRECLAVFKAIPAHDHRWGRLYERVLTHLPPAEPGSGAGPDPCLYPTHRETVHPHPVDGCPYCPGTPPVNTVKEG
jgi:hypothetical protein